MVDEKSEELETKSKKSRDEDDEDSSSDPLVETQINTFVPKSQLSAFDIRNLLVRCSACGKQINHHEVVNVKKHRRLGVVTCRECYEFYGSSEFSQDENGMFNYCHWCGQGGRLIVCDYCPNGFCSSCIRRNFGRKEVSATSTNWKCYVCDPQRLRPKQRYFKLIHQYGKFAREKKEKKVSRMSTLVPTNIKDSVSPSWMREAFSETDSMVGAFQKRLQKLKDIESSHSKSTYHVIKKMDEIINQHKQNLKSVMKKVTENYKMYLAERRTREESDDGVVYLCSSRPKVENGTVNGGDDLCVEVSEVGNAKESEESVVRDVLNETLDSVSKATSDSENERAKKMLLENTSSENESDGAPPEAKPVQNDDSKKEVHAKRKLEFSAPESEVSSIESARSNLDSSHSEGSAKVRKKKKIHASKAADKSKCEETKLSPEVKDKLIRNFDDPKLKLEAQVLLEPCDKLGSYALSANLTSAKAEAAELEPKSQVIDDLERLEKVIASLSKFPEIKKKEEKDDKPAKIPKKKVKATPKKEKDSSSSICFSSDEEEDEKPKKKIELKSVDPNVLARNELMRSDSSDSESESDSEEEKPTKKKAKAAKGSSVSSEDDFQPSKKKKKYDKLLSARITVLDDSDEAKEKISRGKHPGKRKAILLDEAKKDSKRRSSSEHTTTSDSDEEKGKRGRRKLKRIKKMDSSSSEKGSDADGKDKDTTPGKGRKNIKKIISGKKLTEETKEAQLEEKERKRRIADRQKLYNQITDTSEDGKNVITRKLVLEVDPESKEEMVEISPDLIEKLKVHQVNGVKFMWECTIESLKDLLADKPGSGCILAHCMGLGKTLQVITFLHTCMTNKYVKKKISTAMVVCPYNTILNWSNEFEMWLEDTEGDIKVHQFSVAKDNWTRLDVLKWWQKEGGVLILSYDILRRLVGPLSKGGSKTGKLKPKMRKQFEELLVDPGPDIVICDEGHVLKNESSAISKAMSNIRTKRRIVLTGTPLQNNLQEYHCMLSFVKPHLLGTAKEFRNRFVNPIQNGQYDDSTQYDVKLMKKRTHILHKLLDGCVQRCDYSSLTKFLPPKHEFVISVKLSDVQIKMYRKYLEMKDSLSKTNYKGAMLFQDFTALRCVWTHPYSCSLSYDRAEHRRMLNEWKDEEEDDNDSFINDDSEEEGSVSSKTGSEGGHSSADEVVRKYKTRSRCEKGTEIGESSKQEDEPTQEKEKQWFDEFVSEEDHHNIQLSGKMILLMEILKECEAIGDKIIVFSQSLLTLDMIEDLLSSEDQKAQEESDAKRDIIGTWVKGSDYFRMDGTTSADFRKTYIDMFNNPDYDRARLFLISTRAGGLGTNLVGANRVVIMDASWNPSHDVQAIFRVFRFGQKKPVYIYRLLAQGTMEEKIYDRQVTKLSLSIRVVDEQQIDRHFSAADLAELYTFNPDTTKDRPTPMVPKDRLLAELLIKQSEWIVTYHEHDSLLQNEREEDLTEEERQSAWNEYENEREGKLEDDPTNMLINMGTSQLFKEPDNTQADYEGNMLPTVHAIFTHITGHYTKQTPNLSQKELLQKGLVAMDAARGMLQALQVKYLRMKQEFFAKGSVPNYVNKYLDELTSLMKNMTLFSVKARQTLMSQTANQQPNPQPRYAYQPQSAAQMENLRRWQEQVQGQFRGQRVVFGMSGQRPMVYMNRNAGPYVRPQQQYGVPPSYIKVMRVPAPNVPRGVSQPIVVESEEGPNKDKGESIPVASNQSTVVIEEIT